MPESINPASGGTIAHYPEHSPREVETRLARAHQRAPAWNARGFEARGDAMRRAATILRRDETLHARLMVEEMGKPIRQARAEVQKCATALEFAAHRAEAVLAPEGDVVAQALGPILGVMPWNFPYWQAIRFAGPAVMAGNVTLVKHASNVTGCLVALEDVFREADAADAFQALVIPSARVEGVLRDPRVRGVSLTGSEAAGVAVARVAAEEIKPVVLELGGSDPFLVLEDADVEETARRAAHARCINNGQSCIAAKRFLVAEPIREAFTQAFVRAMEALRVGDPMTESTELGPLARTDLRDAVQDQVERTVASGAKLLTGGAIPEGPGAWYPATLLSDVPRKSPAMQEEVFGPVAPVVGFHDETDGISIADDTRFGLGASVWSRDASRARRVALRMDAGMVFVNHEVASDPARPFGGTKRSGIGRELGDEGFRSFVNLKTLVAKAPGKQAAHALVE